MSISAIFTILPSLFTPFLVISTEHLSAVFH